jgi:hypothetical protein
MAMSGTNTHENAKIPRERRMDAPGQCISLNQIPIGMREHPIAPAIKAAFFMAVGLS